MALSLGTNEFTLSYHRPSKPLHRSVLRFHGVLHPAAFQHGNAVCILHDLIHFVGNNDDALSVIRHIPQNLEHLHSLLGSQHCRRFIQDQHLSASVQKLHDLHSLLLSHGKLPDQCLGIHLQVKRLGAFRNRILHLLFPEDPLTVRHIQEHILRHRQCGDQTEMLMHHSNSQIHSMLRSFHGNFLPFEINLAFVWTVDSGQDVHQGALSGTVGT